MLCQGRWCVVQGKPKTKMLFLLECLRKCSNCSELVILSPKSMSLLHSRISSGTFQTAATIVWADVALPAITAAQKGAGGGVLCVVGTSGLSVAVAGVCCWNLLLGLALASRRLLRNCLRCRTRGWEEVREFSGSSCLTTLATSPPERLGALLASSAPLMLFFADTEKTHVPRLT